MVITYINISRNGTITDERYVRSWAEFSTFMANTHANDTANLTVYYKGKLHTFTNITLVDKYEHYYKIEEFRGKGFLGVATTGASELINVLAHPIGSAEGNFAIALNNIFLYVAKLPLQGTILPFHKPLTDAYEPQGAWKTLPPEAFWVLANMFYYLFWLNFLIGTFNALPAVPLDGGFLFRDGVDTIIGKLKRNLRKEQREYYVRAITHTVAIFILLLIVWQLIAPRLSYLF
jgi:membrane-associated protease RseP (regulator of RpoE activity)